MQNKFSINLSLCVETLVLFLELLKYPCCVIVLRSCLDNKIHVSFKLLFRSHPETSLIILPYVAAGCSGPSLQAAL